MQLDQSTLEENWKFSQSIIDNVIWAKGNMLWDMPWWITVNYDEVISQVKEIYSSLPKKYSQLLVLWIGWSALWTTSSLDALWKWENVIVLDTVDPEYCEKILENIDWKNTLVNVISKSWSTLETLAQTSLVKKIIIKNNLLMRDHFVITTWPSWSLRDFANDNWLLVLDVPESAWWRFSVFTQVSLFPLYFAWVDIDNFIYWLRQCVNEFENNDFSQNIPMKLAASQYVSYKDFNKNISVFFTYNKWLLNLWDWYRQLLAESIGKNKEVWITPVSAFWSTDQHSQLQLYLDWPEDKLFTFVNSWFKKWLITWSDFKYLDSKTFWEIQSSFLEGTKKSFLHHKITFQEISLDSNEKDIAYFLASLMINIWLLWELFAINAYDQRAVEYWKIKSKELLS